MNAQIGGAHDIVAQHLAAVVPDPVLSVIAHLPHGGNDAVHVQVVIGLLAVGSVYGSRALGKDRTVPVVGSGLACQRLAPELCFLLVGQFLSGDLSGLVLRPGLHGQLFLQDRSVFRHLLDQGCRGGQGRRPDIALGSARSYLPVRTAVDAPDFDLIQLFQLHDVFRFVIGVCLEHCILQKPGILLHGTEDIFFDPEDLHGVGPAHAQTGDSLPSAGERIADACKGSLLRVCILFLIFSLFRAESVGKHHGGLCFGGRDRKRPAHRRRACQENGQCTAGGNPCSFHKLPFKNSEPAGPSVR